MATNKPHDVFISYRRSDGADLAKIVADGLQQRGFRVFRDIHQLDSGPFPAQIERAIIDTPGFVLLLTPESLERCISPSDWLTREIDLAVRHERRIVPLMVPRFRSPPSENLPDSVRHVLKYQRVTFHHEYDDASLDRLAESLRASSVQRPTASTTRGSCLGRFLYVVLAGVLLVALVAIFSNWRPSCRSTPDGTSKVPPSGPPPSPRPPSTLPTMRDVLGMEFVLIPAGCFQMGCADEEEKANLPHEQRHLVRLTKPFYIARTEVTQKQWREVMQENPNPSTGGQGDDLPVDTISWHDAMAFCAAVSKRAGRTYRLPTEAEWEYACRAGTLTPFYTGATVSAAQANFDSSETYGGSKPEPKPGRSRPVASYPPNPWGLYDMMGNVTEWCSDYQRSYPNAAVEVVDPIGGAQDGDEDLRNLRGGAYPAEPWRCRSAYRWGLAPTKKGADIGFRVVRELDASEQAALLVPHSQPFNEDEAWRSGHSAFEANDYADAAEHFGSLASRAVSCTRRAESAYWQGVCYRSMAPRRMPEAIAAFRIAVALKVDYYDALAGLASAMEQNGQDDEALKLFDQALNAARRQGIARPWMVYSDRGLLHAKNGRWTDADADLTKAIDWIEANDTLGVHPDDRIAAYENRARAREKLGRTSEAKSDAETAEKLRKKCTNGG